MTSMPNVIYFAVILQNVVESSRLRFALQLRDDAMTWRDTVLLMPILDVANRYNVHTNRRQVDGTIILYIT